MGLIVSDTSTLIHLAAIGQLDAIGLLIRAKREGYIDLLKPELDRLLHQGGFWIEEGLYRRVLDAVDEASESS